MTIAITPFDGLCGFRPIEEISHFLSSITPLKRVVGAAAAQQFNEAAKSKEQNHKDALQALFKSLMTASAETIAEEAKQLVQCAKESKDGFAASGGSSSDMKELSELVIRLNEQFPTDIGLFTLFLLNYVKLEPGEAMFLKADDIHAYLSGGKLRPDLDGWI